MKKYETTLNFNFNYLVYFYIFNLENIFWIKEELLLIFQLF
jgi:hypothetical protein